MHIAIERDCGDENGEDFPLIHLKVGGHIGGEEWPRLTEREAHIIAIALVDACGGDEGCRQCAARLGQCVGGRVAQFVSRTPPE